MYRNFATIAKIRYVAKIRYTSENSLCSEIVLCREIAIHSENFAIVAKFCYNRKVSPVAPACFCLLLDQLLHSWLDAIEDKSFKLDVNQLNFDMISLI